MMAGLFAMLTSFFSSCNAGSRKYQERPREKQIIKISWNSFGDSNGCNYEYAMENANGNYKVRIHEQPSHNGKARVTNVNVAQSDLDQLFEHIEKYYTYKKWKEFPKSEVHALDAATNSVSIRLRTKEGDEIFSVSDSKAFPKGQERVFYDVREFIHSYAAHDAQTATLKRTGFDANACEEGLKIDNPGMLRVEIYKKYGDTDSSKEGRYFDVKYIFYGRIPGETKLRFPKMNMDNTIEYKVIVDKEFNVTLKRIM